MVLGVPDILTDENLRLIRVTLSIKGELTYHIYKQIIGCHNYLPRCLARQYGSGQVRSITNLWKLRKEPGEDAQTPQHRRYCCKVCGNTNMKDGRKSD